MNNMEVFKFLKGNILLVITLILMILTSCLVRPNFHAINFQVLFILFDLMLISSVLERYGLLKALSLQIVTKFNSQRKLSVAMILLTALFAMLFTNDVALFVVIPLTIVIYKNIGKNPIRLVVLEGLAANIGGSFSPLGSPQNMFLYLKYDISMKMFFSITALFTLVGLYWLMRTALRFNKQEIKAHYEKVEVEKKGVVLLYLILFCVTVYMLSIHFNLLWITLVIVFVTIEANRKSFLHVDYSLLIVFIGFFITFDNLSRMAIFDIVGVLGKNPIAVYLMAAFLPQVMSNVPTALFLSKFTLLYKPLLLGANVGGLGNIIASMANLIVYRLYRGSFKKEKFFPYFFKMNWTLFGILFCINGLLLLVVFLK